MLKRRTNLKSQLIEIGLSKQKAAIRIVMPIDHQMHRRLSYLNYCKNQRGIKAMNRRLNVNIYLQVMPWLFDQPCLLGVRSRVNPQRENNSTSLSRILWLPPRDVQHFLLSARLEIRQGLKRHRATKEHRPVFSSVTHMTIHMAGQLATMECKINLQASLQLSVINNPLSPNYFTILTLGGGFSKVSHLFDLSRAHFLLIVFDYQ